MRYTPSLLTGIALIVSLSLGSAASAQSLGDLARKEQERRKTVATGKVYTNDSLGSPAPAPAPPPSSSQQAPSQDQSKTPGDKAAAGEKPAGEKPAASDGTAKDEAYWRARIQTERDAIERAKVLVGALQSRISALQTDFVNRDDPAARTVITADRERALAELERTNLEIKQRTQAIADIQEEARRAGAPAAWYR